MTVTLYNVKRKKGNAVLAVHLTVNGRAVRYHLKYVYHDTIVRVLRYTLGIDTSHDTAYMK